MTTEYKKQLPPITTSVKPYYDAARRHELVACKCLNCGRYYWPAVHCMACESPKMEWVGVSGKGEVYSFVIIHQVYHPGWKDDVPYNVCFVKLDEGPYLLTNVVGCQNEDLYIGMRVEVVFEDVTEEVALTKFKPVA